MSCHSGDSGAGPWPRAGLQRLCLPCRPHSESPAVSAPPGKIGIESAMTKTPADPDLLPVLDELKAGIDRLISGLELPKPVPVPEAEPAAVETPAAEAA